MRRRLHQWLGIVPLAALLAACGFQLQGQRALPEPLQSVYIDMVQPYAVAAPRVETALRTRLRRRGGNVAGSPADARSVLELRNLVESSEVLSIGPDGRAIEFEVRVEVTFALRQNGKLLVSPQTLRASQALSFPSEQILPKEAEERRLRNFLQDELAERILLQLEVRLGRNNAYAELD